MLKMRTNKPEANNKYYNTKAKGGYSSAITGKPADKGCNVLANCVGYANGRFNEIGDHKKIKYSFVWNAEQFIMRAKELKLEVTDEPTLGGIMVWQKGATLKGKDGAGHVEIVEKINNSNQVYNSASAWNGPAFYNVTRNKGNGNWGMGASYKYLGCIKNPAVKEEPKPEPAPEPTPVVGFKKGERVVPTALVNYTGTKLTQWDKEYVVYEDSHNDRVVLAANRHGKLVIWAALNTKNVRRV